MRIALVFAAGLALGACNQASGSQATTSASTVVPSSASQTPLEPQARPEVEVETFARELYTAIFEDGLAPLDTAQRGLWTPEAWADIEAAWERDPGAISVDPLCQCQDPTGMSAGDISATLNGQTAEAVVEVVQGGSRVPVTLRLRRVNDGWAIDDVVEASGRTFREALAAGEA